MQQVLRPPELPLEAAVRVYARRAMLLCYVDEAGNDQVLDKPEVPPVLAIAGLTVAESNSKALVWDFIQLKKQFNPQVGQGQLSDLIKYEVKGSDLRADLRSDSRRRTRRAARFVDEVLTLLETHNCSISGSVRVKPDHKGIPTYHYADSIAMIAADFQAQLGAAGTTGLMILDARTKTKNTPSVHTITTRRFRTGGDLLPNLLESPVFGHSDCHVALQLADIVVSALIFPMACATYCSDAFGSTHQHPAYEEVRTRWGGRLHALEHRYLNSEGVRRGGVVVKDHRSSRQSHEMYGIPRRRRNGVPSVRGGTKTPAEWPIWSKSREDPE